MSKMVQLVDEMAARLKQIAEAEQTLVRALGEALNRVDHKLLEDVRGIATEHESRRRTILHELQSLANRIGAFPVPHETVTSVDYAATVPHLAPANANEPSFGAGDWRQAASNIEDELDLFCRKRAVSN
ncbi:MAG: hypothetical protein F9K29_12485 [Hyphomicrobiaceae bacterium]|nr:MAG: hypothetical protein F9K29_12485 [Hyphomicrobiaceae bacterium]